MSNFNTILWRTKQTIKFEQETVILNLTDRLLLFSFSHNNYVAGHHFLGYGNYTVSTRYKSAVITDKTIPLFYGDNILIIPNYLERYNINIKFKRFHQGLFSLQILAPSSQIIINPLTGQPVTLGQESLNQIKNIINEAM